MQLGRVVPGPARRVDPPLPAGENPRYAEFLDRGTVNRMIEEHQQGSSKHAELLLAILMLEVFLDAYIPRALQPPPVLYGAG